MLDVLKESLGRQYEAGFLRVKRCQDVRNLFLLYQLARAQQAVGKSVAATASVRQALAMDGAHAGSRELLAQLNAVTATSADVVIRR